MIMNNKSEPQYAKNIVSQTKKWIESVVIALNFCPFASQPLCQNKVKYKVACHPDSANILEDFKALLQSIESEKYDTGFLILSTSPSFELYLDLLYLLEGMIEYEGFSGIYQLASFHPDYRFDSCEYDDPANYTNRSPHAMFHVLKEEELTKVVDKFPELIEQIPEQNIKRCRHEGVKKLDKLLIKSSI